MKDSSGSENAPDLDALAAKHEQNRRRRIEAVKRWVRYIQENPPETWGAQQNALVDSQLESARRSGLDASHYRRIRRSTRER